MNWRRKIAAAALACLVLGGVGLKGEATALAASASAEPDKVTSEIQAGI